MSLQVVATRPLPALINRIGFGFAIDYDEVVKLRSAIAEFPPVTILEKHRVFWAGRHAARLHQCSCHV
jgi:hypothetical protein